MTTRNLDKFYNLIDDIEIAMMKTDFDWLDDRRGRWMHVFGRLKPRLSAFLGAVA